MLFSVVIPTYNRAQLLGETLGSVFAQEFRDFEVIVVDDGSTDDTSCTVRAFGQRVRLLQQKNKGPGAARNLGIAHALGDYIAFLDSDDLWFPWTLSVYARAIDLFHQPSFVSGRAVTLSDCAGAETARTPLCAKGYANMLSVCHETVPPVGGTSSIVVSARLARDTGGFCEGHINGEDTDLWLRLGKAPNFVRIHEPEVFALRYHEKSMVRNLDASIRGTLFLIRRETEGAYPGGDRFKRRRRRIIAANARNVSLACLRSGEQTTACRLYGATLTWNFWLGRAKYLLGFPILLLLSLVSGRRQYSRRTSST